MKRVWMLILLISLGLNLGLAIKVFTGPGEDSPRGERRFAGRRGEARDWPAPADTVAFRKLARERLARVSERLDLTPEQQAAFEENQEAAMHRLAGRLEGVQESRDRIRGLMEAETIDPSAVRAAHSELGRRQAELDSLVTESILADLQILTPGQRERYLRMHPFGPGGRGGGRHGDRRGPPRP